MAVVRCQHCGESVTAIESANVRLAQAASSELGGEWVIYEGGEELHRCPSSLKLTVTEERGVRS